MEKNIENLVLDPIDGIYKTKEEVVSDCKKAGISKKDVEQKLSSDILKSIFKLSEDKRPQYNS